MSEDVRFAGYAAVFDRVDHGGDVVRPGAFAGVAAGVPLLWQHLPGEAIGTVERVEEDARGLRVIGRVSGDWRWPGGGAGFEGARGGWLVLWLSGAGGAGGWAA